MPKIQFLKASQTGEGRETIWKATAVLAVTGEIDGNRLPKWRRPGNRLERHCQIGDARGTTWEATAKTAVTGKVIGNGPPKRRCLEKRLGSRCRMGRWRGSGWETIAKTVTSGNEVSRNVRKGAKSCKPLGTFAPLRENQMDRRARHRIRRRKKDRVQAMADKGRSAGAGPRRGTCQVPPCRDLASPAPCRGTVPTAYLASPAFEVF